MLLPSTGGPWLHLRLLLGTGRQGEGGSSLGLEPLTPKLLLGDGTRGPDGFSLPSPQLLQRQGAQLLAQTRSRACFHQWKQQVGASKKPLPPPTAS